MVKFFECHNTIRIRSLIQKWPNGAMTMEMRKSLALLFSFARPEVSNCIKIIMRSIRNEKSEGIEHREKANGKWRID